MGFVGSLSHDRLAVPQEVSREIRLNLSSIQELMSTAHMVQSHTEGGMTAKALAAWLRGADQLKACAVLQRAAVLMGHEELGGVVVVEKSVALMQAGECMLGVLNREEPLTWPAYLRVSAAVLEAHDGLLLEMQAVCYDRITAAELLAVNHRPLCYKRLTRSLELERQQSKPPPRRSLNMM